MFCTFLNICIRLVFFNCSYFIYSTCVLLKFEKNINTFHSLTSLSCRVPWFWSHWEHHTCQTAVDEKRQKALSRNLANRLISDCRWRTTTSTTRTKPPAKPVFSHNKDRQLHTRRATQARSRNKLCRQNPVDSLQNRVCKFETEFILFQFFFFALKTPVHCTHKESDSFKMFPG